MSILSKVLLRSRSALPRVPVVSGVRSTHLLTGIRSNSNSTSASATTTTTASKEDLEEDSVPWYLRDETLSPLMEKLSQPMPELPENSPTSVKLFVDTLANKYGMSDIEVFDMTQRDHEIDDESLADYNIICTGKSEKHVYKAAYELRAYLKSTYANGGRIEGMVSSAMSPVERRRLLKRAGKGPLKADSDYGLKANSWVMCNTFVDNIYIHILTKDRREQLCLESLWCPESEKEKYLARGDDFGDSDDIFIGIRRHFHTSTAFAVQRRGYSSVSATEEKTKALESLLNKVTSNTGTGAPVEPFLLEVEANFDSLNLDHHVLRSQIFQAIHRLHPDHILSQQVHDALLAKYGHLLLALNSGTQLDNQRTNDIVSYIEHLLDLPENNGPLTTEGVEDSNWRKQVDELFDQLSKFTEKLYMFSTSELELSALAALIPLLWRLTWIEREGQTSVTPRMVENTLVEPESFSIVGSGEPSILLASNRAADVLQLIEYTNKNTQKLTTRAFNELVMFTYGNAGKWNKFWDQWEVHMNLLAVNGTAKSDVLSKWARLVTYLALRNDPEPIVFFFNSLWDATSLLSLSFMSDFRLAEGLFASKEEKQCVKNALKHMLQTVNSDAPSVTNYRAVEALVNEL